MREIHNSFFEQRVMDCARKIYAGAELDSIQVGRSISQKGSSRGKVAELFAIYRQK